MPEFGRSSVEMEVERFLGEDGRYSFISFFGFESGRIGDGRYVDWQVRFAEKLKLTAFESMVI